MTTENVLERLRAALAPSEPLEVDEFVYVDAPDLLHVRTLLDSDATDDVVMRIDEALANVDERGRVRVGSMDLAHLIRRVAGDDED